MTDSDVQILICSCDNYSDVWDPFFTLFFRYWPDCPYKINLIANHKTCLNPRVATIATDPNSDWSSAFLHALSTICSKYVIVVMEDYLLTTPVSTETIRSMGAFMDGNGVSCLYLHPIETKGPTVARIAGFEVCEVRPGTAYRINLQAAVWQKSYLESIVRKGENAWSFEVCGSRRSTEARGDIFSVNCAPDRSPLPYYCTGVVRGVWMPGAVRLCKKEGVAIDFSKRRVGWIRGMFRDYRILRPVRLVFVFVKRLLGLH